MSANKNEPESSIMTANIFMSTGNKYRTHHEALKKPAPIKEAGF